MGILQIKRVEVGEVGDLPGSVKVVTTDSLATITTAGYFNNSVVEGINIQPTDILEVLYSFNPSTNSGSFVNLTISISGSGVITATALVNPANVLLPVVSGDFAVFNGITGQIKDSSYSPSNAAKTKVVMANGAVTVGHIATYADVNGTITDAGASAVLGQAASKAVSDNTKASVASVNGATIANHIATYVDVAGTIGEDAATAINGGNIYAGLSGTAGALASFPAAALSGKLGLAAVTNASGDFSTTISNAAAVAQNQVISVPDCGAVSANFILSSTVAAAQTLSGSLSFVGGGSNIQLTGGGNFLAGSSGAAGFFVSYPPAAASGRLIIEAINSGNFDLTINNEVMAQATILSITDPKQATGSIMVSKVAADAGANLISFDITVGQGALAGGGSVNLVVSSGTKQYKIRSLQLNSGGTNFSGGGGDRLGEVTDGVTVYSIIPAATMQALANEQWGAVGLPNPAAAAINTSTAPGANLVFKYNTGTTDYTAGSLVISGIVERVA